MIHLHTHSWFSFLAGGSSPEALAQRAAVLGQPALALTDRHGVYGAVRFAAACRRLGLRPVFGASVAVTPAPRQEPATLVLLVEDREGYANLCRLLSLSHRTPMSRPAPPEVASGRGQPEGASAWPGGPLAEPDHRQPSPLALADLEGLTAGLLCLTGGPEGHLSRLLAARRLNDGAVWLRALSALFPGSLYVELVHADRPGETVRLQREARLAREMGVPTVVSNAVRFATPADFARYDALTCVRLGLTVGDPHPERPVNDRASLCSAEDVARWLGPLEVDVLGALERTHEVASRCLLDLLPGEVTPPTALLPAGQNPDQFLRGLCEEALPRRYPEGAEKARQQMEHELTVVSELELSEFFLVVREVTHYARSQGIRNAGRGSAANSILAYLLGITTVDPIRHRLLFERFLHRGRKGMPDIDVDFDSDRREEVIAWMEQRFGADHCAMTATIQTYQLKGAVREMMKVLGWDLKTIDKLGRSISYWDTLEALRARRTELEEMLGGPTPLLDVLFKLVEGVLGCPRHLGLHNGGMVLTREPLACYSPVQTSAGGFREVQFDKDDVEALGLIKFDVLGLRMLAVLSEAVHLLGDSVTLEDLPLDDELTFELIRSGETMSLFQIESPGQMNLVARTQPLHFDDLIAQVALFRPGPLQGGMVHPYVLRRAGAAPVTYLHPVLEPVLADTYGIILFQEQVLEICHQFAGLSLEDADEFRRLMSKWRDPGNMQAMGQRFIDSAIEVHGCERAVAEEVFRQVSAFVGYGFCRSHAAAFALTVYHSAYLKAHHPAAYMAAVLEHKPGFFPMSTVLEEARRMGVRFLPVCAWRSGVRYALENGAVRIPLTQIHGFSRESALALVSQRQGTTLDELARAVPDLTRDHWQTLARAGAFDLHLPRREALWRVGLGGKPSTAKGNLGFKMNPRQRPVGPRGAGAARLQNQATRPRRPVQQELWVGPPDGELLPELAPLEEPLRVTWDYATQNLSTAGHPLSFHREALDALEVMPIGTLKRLPLQPPVVKAVAGLVIVRQKPPTARGMVFVMLEDETGRVQVAVAPPVFERFQQVVVRSPALWVRGKLEGSGSYRSLMVVEAANLEELLGRSIFTYDAM